MFVPGSGHRYRLLLGARVAPEVGVDGAGVANDTALRGFAAGSATVLRSSNEHSAQALVDGSGERRRRKDGSGSPADAVYQACARSLSEAVAEYVLERLDKEERGRGEGVATCRLGRFTRAVGGGGRGTRSGSLR